MKLLILTGAGISVPSGIPDYRSQNGLWNNENVNHVATQEAYLNNPKKVSLFFKNLYEQYKDAKPNEGHFAITKLQEKHDVKVITQNVDDLHEKAGTQEIYHLHGSIFTWVNLDTNEKVHISQVTDFDKFRPNIVLYGETPHYCSEIFCLVKDVDIFIVIGSSLMAGPANQIHSWCPEKTRKIYISKEIINPKILTEYKEIYKEDIVEFLPSFLEKI